MIEVQVLIPVLSNAGETFSAEHDGVFEAFLLTKVNGFSRQPGLVAGAWIGEGGFTYRDANRVYTVALDSIVLAGVIGEIAEFAKVHYGQLAIYVRYMNLSEVL